MAATSERLPTMVPENERPVLAKVVQLFKRQPATPVTVGAGTQMQVQLPASTLILVRQLIEALANGDAVTLVPVHKELTTQELADLLNVSRTHVISLLEAGEIPFTRARKHRRIRFDDFMAYKRKRDAEQAQALDALTQLNQDLGLYDDE